ncbi:MAG: hypothetical protein HRT47_10670 [Candidatus Caenarcaniphilales bacterium]|nr:hypothetical protein [Candidatus Caenarcaniphilales bacterium]
MRTNDHIRLNMPSPVGSITPKKIGEVEIVNDVTSQPPIKVIQLVEEKDIVINAELEHEKASVLSAPSEDYISLYQTINSSNKRKEAALLKISSYYHFSLGGIQATKAIQDKFRENPETSPDQIRNFIRAEFEERLNEHQFKILDGITDDFKEKEQEFNGALSDAFEAAIETGTELWGLPENTIKIPSNKIEWQQLLWLADEGNIDKSIDNLTLDEKIQKTARLFKKHLTLNLQIGKIMDINPLIIDKHIDTVEISLLNNAPGVTFGFLEMKDKAIDNFFATKKATVRTNGKEMEPYTILAGPSASIYDPLIPVNSPEMKIAKEVNDHEFGHLIYGARRRAEEKLNGKPDIEKGFKYSDPLTKNDLEHFGFCSEKVINTFEENKQLFLLITKTELIEHLKMNEASTIFNNDRFTPSHDSNDYIQKSFLANIADSDANLELIKNIDLRVKLGLVDKNAFADLVYAAPDPFSLMILMEKSIPIEAASTEKIIQTIDYINNAGSFYDNGDLERLLAVLEKRPTIEQNKLIDYLNEKDIANSEHYFASTLEESKNHFIYLNNIEKNKVSNLIARVNENFAKQHFDIKDEDTLEAEYFDI